MFCCLLFSSQVVAAQEDCFTGEFIIGEGQYNRTVEMVGCKNSESILLIPDVNLHYYFPFFDEFGNNVEAFLTLSGIGEPPIFQVNGKLPNTKKKGRKKGKIVDEGFVWSYVKWVG